MTDQDNTPPAVWDPAARGGAGGWVRRRPGPPEGGVPGQPPRPGPPGHDAQETTVLPPVPSGPAGGGGTFPGARPYVSAGPPPAAGFPPPPPQAPQAFPSPPPGFPPPHGAPPAPQGFPQAAPQQPDRPFDGPFDGPFGPAQPYTQQQPFGQAPQPPFDRPAPGGAAPYGPAGAAYGGHDPATAPPYGTQGPGYEDLDAEEPPRRRSPLLIAAGVLLVLVLGGGVVWAVQGSGPDGKGSAAPTAAPAASSKAPQAAPSAPAASSPAGSAPASPGAGAGAEAQAKALDALLARGENAKAPIGSAVAKVSSCPAKAEIESAAQVFDDGAAQRDKLVADLAALGLADLPGGAGAAQTLKSAWQVSGDIDRAYAAWARTVASQGCTGSTAPDTADRRRANDLNPQATRSKKDFVAQWNAIATTYGLTERTWDRI
ncbi:hypothetical protein KNE206_13850 [Kitasatospora sp. NE20-6]|uniref:hypothetical protein n=1 Tax=Kitasatospora sp. NE20-6 TaxID=2859066 RepID=UPI0034DB97CC